MQVVVGVDPSTLKGPTLLHIGDGLSMGQKVLQVVIGSGPSNLRYPKLLHIVDGSPYGPESAVNSCWNRPLKFEGPPNYRKWGMDRLVGGESGVNSCWNRPLNFEGSRTIAYSGWIASWGRKYCK